MALTCTLCERDMAVAYTCDPDLRPGVTPYGQDLPDYGPEREWLPSRCWRCGVIKGGAHHPSCTIAGCLTHGYDQRIACGCDEDPDDAA